MYRVKDVMTDEVATCGLEDSLESAVRIMRERGCGSVPIVDANLHVVGLVTDRDAVMCALQKGKALRDLRVGEAASRDVVCCDIADTLERVEMLMRVNHVRRLPVIGAGRELVGVISLTDLARNVEVSPVEGCSGLSPRQIAVVLAETSGVRRLLASTDARRGEKNGPHPIVERIFHG
jgi:CBS domain-containing protein